MAEEVIGLLFGVEGGGSIDGASGKQIVKDLTDIVKAINSGNSDVPKIKFHFDTTEATQAVDDLKKKLKDIEKVASIKITYSNGRQGGSGGHSGHNPLQELQAEMSKVAALQKKMSSISVKIGKLELDNGDVKLISAYRAELERLEGVRAELMGTFMDKLSMSADAVIPGDIDVIYEQVQNLKNIEEATIAAAKAKKEAQATDMQTKQITKELRTEMNDLVALQKQISSTKTTIIGLELNDESVNVIDVYREKLERLEIQYAQMSKVLERKLLGSENNITQGDLDAFNGQIEELKQVEEHTISVAAAKAKSANETENQQRRYEELLDVVSRWTKESKTAAKLAAEYGNVTRDLDGHLNDTASGYEETTQRINATVQAMKQLQIIFQKDKKTGVLEIIKPDDFEEVAKALGITTEQYEQLFAKVVEGSKVAAEAMEGADRKNQQSWTATASKIRDEVQRMYHVIAKDPNSKRLANNIIKHSKAASGSVGDLKNEYDELRDAIHKSGADIETWGDRFKKSFADNLRSGLAGSIIAAAGKYLRDIYQSVVDIDKATVDLQIATGKTRDDVKSMTKEYSQLAKTLGATTTEVMQSADTWLRQGHSAEDANTLIVNSTMLSKLGQMEAADAAKALTSAMKGYSVSVNDSVGIVDKFTAVDMEAAASAGDIATALSETAASAKNAGVSMDTLIGYIATVKEVTQDGAESVGTFYRTLFARMNNIKVGKFVDDETGEALNDVEKVLGELNISLRDTNDRFRNSDEVINEVGHRWNEFNDVEKRAIATAFAGTKQQEKFMVLMQNFDTAMQYATVSTESAGTAMEKFSDYTEGVEGKMNALKASFEELSITVLDSDLIADGVEFITQLLDGLTSLVDAIGGLNTILIITGGIIATLKLESIMGFFPKLIGKISDFRLALKIARGDGMAMGASISAAFDTIGISVSTAQVAVASFTAIISAAIIAVNVYNTAIQNKINNSLSAADAANREGKEYLNTAKSLRELVNEYEALAEVSEGGVFDNEAVEKVRSIQNKITDLVGDQADNLDLVNGKLDEEIRKMRELATGTGGAVDNAIKQGETEIANATNAYKTKSDSAFGSYHLIIGEASTSHLFGAFEDGGVTDFTKEWTDEFGVSLEKHELYSAALGMETGYGYGFKYDFDTIEEFIKQYEGIAAMQQELAGKYGESELFKATTTFLSDYKDIYEQYQSGKLLIEEANKAKSEVEDLFEEPSNNGITVTLKSAYDVLDEIRDGYDGLSSALTDVTSEGYLTADALSALFKLEKDNALAGLELANILDQDANGYKLRSNALEQYVQKLITAYEEEVKFAEVFASEKDKENAIKNFETLRSVIAALIATQDEAVDASKAYKESLEKEQEMHEGQLNKFEELIDLRKDLLQTYKEELDYQKELEKRQRNVATLQTKLAIARLDNSAAGQARVRELEAELKEAQDELEDFTLEHAIDVLTDQLDSTNAEWKSIIQTKLDEITKLLDGLDTSPVVNITTDTSWMQDVMARIERDIAELKKTDASGDNPAGEDTPNINANQPSIKSDHNAILKDDLHVYEKPTTLNPSAIIQSIDEPGNKTTGADKINNVGKGESEIQDRWDDYWYNQNPGMYGPPPLEQFSADVKLYAKTIKKLEGAKGHKFGSFFVNDGIGPEYISLNDKKYRVDALSLYEQSSDIYKAAVDICGITDGDVFQMYDHKVQNENNRRRYFVCYNGKIYAIGYRTFHNDYGEFLSDVTGSYHSGGLVGNVSTLSTSEEFAKLLKGEFVSTPAQMKRFMEETLPQIANYTASGGTNEFNAPLIEITCESVTSETLPELKRIVGEAVNEIKRELDSGMSRAGFKRQTTKRLT